LQLCLGEITEEGVSRAATTEKLLKYNFNPDEPRDSRGRWTTEGDADPEQPAPGSSSHREQESGGSAGSAGSSSAPRTLRGLASYYNLVGRRMANGRIFDPRAMQAAMLRVPLGTAVTVRLAEDPSRFITVTITDRGPYGPGRIIDLTPAAFEALVGSTRPGLANVIVTIPEAAGER
jgi:rare lipoprotein A